MDDSYWYARLSAHLNNKKAGPIVFHICNNTERF